VKSLSFITKVLLFLQGFLKLIARMKNPQREVLVEKPTRQQRYRNAMRASIKQFYVSAGIFAVFFMATALVFRRVPSGEQFYAFGICGVLFSFLTAAWARIPKEDFAPRDGARAFRVFRRVMKLVFTGILGSTAILCFGVFVLVLWIKITRRE
jgi:hypothetical protein